MLYDPVKDRLFALARRHPVAQKVFYRLLGAVFLRTWYVKRVIDREMANRAGEDPIRVLDAGTGQNALNQAREFNQAIGLTGITITKLDGTARGGVLFGIAHELGVPIRFIGVGEAAKDLRPFDAGSFVNAILPVD